MPDEASASPQRVAADILISAMTNGYINMPMGAEPPEQKAKRIGECYKIITQGVKDAMEIQASE